jgi:hypothetical protein
MVHAEPVGILKDIGGGGLMALSKDIGGGGLMALSLMQNVGRLHRRRSFKSYRMAAACRWLQPTGARWWRLARFAGKQKLLALGVYPAVSLAEARRVREEAKKLLAAGVDPSQAKKQKKGLERSSRQAQAVVGAPAGAAPPDKFWYVNHLRRNASRFGQRAAKRTSPCPIGVGTRRRPSSLQTMHLIWASSRLGTGVRARAARTGQDDMKGASA